MLSYEQAREKVIASVRALRGPLATETVELSRACGRVLAQSITADRDYPPFDRSIRDGFALRADDAVPGATLRCIGEIKAGSGFDGVVGPGECVQIMTGAAVPPGADAVVMIEHVSIEGERIMLSRTATRGQSIVARAKELARARGLVVFDSFERAAAAFGVAAEYWQGRRGP